MKRLIVAIFLLAGPLYGDDGRVQIIPMDGPIGTAKISPANGSATAYRMDFPGQKSITFMNVATTDVYLSSSTTAGTDGFPLLEIGSFVSLDLKNGTTIYFYGNGASADVRAIFAR